MFDEIVAVKAACGGAHLKVILETGELVTLDNVRRASWLALLAGGDFIKTSTGKVTPAATPPVALVMLEAVRDFADATGELRGVKLAGGIRTTQGGGALPRHGQRGRRRAVADARRCSGFGASSLLNDLLLQRHKLTTGAYDGPDYVSVD